MSRVPVEKAPAWPKLPGEAEFPPSRPGRRPATLFDGSALSGYAERVYRIALRLGAAERPVKFGEIWRQLEGLGSHKPRSEGRTPAQALETWQRQTTARSLALLVRSGWLHDTGQGYRDRTGNSFAAYELYEHAKAWSTAAARMMELRNPEATTVPGHEVEAWEEWYSGFAEQMGARTRAIFESVFGPDRRRPAIKQLPRKAIEELAKRFGRKFTKGFMRPEIQSAVLGPLGLDAHTLFRSAMVKPEAEVHKFRLANNKVEAEEMARAFLAELRMHCPTEETFADNIYGLRISLEHGLPLTMNDRVDAAILDIVLRERLANR